MLLINVITANNVINSTILVLSRAELKVQKLLEGCVGLLPKSRKLGVDESIKLLEHRVFLEPFFCI